MTCNSCGGVIGRDCFNPQECAAIAHDQQMQAQYASQTNDQILFEKIDDLERRVKNLEQLIKGLEKY